MKMEMTEMTRQASPTYPEVCLNETPKKIKILVINIACWEDLVNEIKHFVLNYPKCSIP